MKKEELSSHKSIKELKKKYGPGVITRAEDGYPPVEAISTGCFAIDRVIGCGGLPRGRIIELYGEPSCQIGSDSILLSNGKFKRFDELLKGDSVISPQRDGSNLIASVIKSNKWESNDNYEIINKRSKKVLYTCSSNHLIPTICFVSKKEKQSRETKSVKTIMNLTAKELFLMQKKKTGTISVKSIFTTTPILSFGIKDPTVDPYVLGCLLGDGCITDGIRMTSMDSDIINEMKRRGFKVASTFQQDGNKSTDYRMSRKSSLFTWLKENKLIGKTSHSKFIPNKCKYSSAEYRKNLLAGLIDTDGSLIDKENLGKGNLVNYVYDYSTVSEKLANDIFFLVHSLGGYCHITPRKTKLKNVEFNSFRLYISLDVKLPIKCSRKIKNKQKIDALRYKSPRTHGFELRKAPKATVYGIVLDSPSQWYITNDFLVTHNSGKTATTLYFISEIQKQGGTCAFLDAEYSFNGSFAKSIGVDTKKLFVSQPATLEEGADILRALIMSNQMDLIVVDSVAALVPKREVEGEEMLANSMAVQAQLMSKMLRVLTGEVARSKTVVIFINHLKEKMGIFWGDKSTTPGGKSLKFFASVRLAVSRGEKKTGSNDEQIGSVIKIVAQKNKVAPPWRKGEFTLFYSTGVDHETDTFDTANELGIFDKSGNTYSFEKEKLGVGRNRVIKKLKSNKELYEKIQKITEKIIKEEINKKKSET